MVYVEKEYEHRHALEKEQLAIARTEREDLAKLKNRELALREKELEAQERMYNKEDARITQQQANSLELSLRAQWITWWAVTLLIGALVFGIYKQFLPATVASAVLGVGALIARGIAARSKPKPPALPQGGEVSPPKDDAKP